MEKRLKLRGAIHMHTTLSYDGTMSLAELAKFLKYKGFNFMAITEHSQDVNEDMMIKLEEESKALSTDDFLIIPGIEFTCSDNIHILGLGVISVCRHSRPSDVIDHIHYNGGVAILAHPANRNYPFDQEWVRKLDGSEIWNLSNEGKFLPQIESIKIYRKLMGTNENLKAFSGLDLHRKVSFYYISTTVYAESKTKGDVLNSLKKGAFKIESRFFRTGSGGQISPLYFFVIFIFRKLLNCVRWLRDFLGT
jgi:hypothetical protein